MLGDEKQKEIVKTKKLKKQPNRGKSVVPSGVKRKPASAAVIDLVPALMALKSILVPIDFSETSKKALRYALRFAEQFGGKLTLLNVVEPVATPDFAYYPLLVESDKVKKLAEARLESLCSQMSIPRGLLDQTLVRYGTPFAEICDAARTSKTDLIILTTHGHTGLKHVLLGSTAERVVRHAPCPVLTVREKEHEFV